MKTKLLKKVRKRYSISKVTRKGRNTDKRVEELMAESRNVFILVDHNTLYRKCYYTDYNELYKTLVDWIKADHKKTRKNKELHKKIWY